MQGVHRDAQPVFASDCLPQPLIFNAGNMSRQAMYLRTSEHEEAVRSLEWAAKQASEIASDPYQWKWTLIALHNAAQGFMVLALWNGNGLLTMPDHVAAKWLKAYQGNRQFPEDRLDSFLNLYDKCKNPANFNYCGSLAFAGSAEHDESFSDLNEFRNEFIHFTPKGWSLQLDGLATVVLHALDMIGHFGWCSTSILWHERDHRVRAKWACRALQRTARKLEAQYA